LGIRVDPWDVSWQYIIAYKLANEGSPLHQARCVPSDHMRITKKYRCDMR
jgi:hypothetical protein